ncbi:MAG: molybdopterin biosynthesis protein [Anaerolineaceae bacterium]|nr:MAG: molybdopterin biosynthesis protein [Anaerolineaceae bacterium]
MTSNHEMENIYLSDIPLEKAWDILIEALEGVGLWKPLEAEIISLENALGRVTAEPVWARISSPHYYAAAMDGYTLRSADTSGASDRNPITLEVDHNATYVDTGDPIPTWADAVVPIENVEHVEGTEEPAVRIRAALAPWTHVRAMGEDMVATELVVPAGHQLRPVDLGAIAGSGHDQVHVWRRPRVAIIPTGSELVSIGSEVKPGEIIEYNSLVLGAQVETWGGQATRFPSLPDDFERIREAVAEAAVNHDLVLVNAGSSAGLDDHTAKVVQSLGKLLVHGVAVRPGHPVVLGLVEHTSEAGSPSDACVPVIGVPGYPVSTALTGEIFVEPLLARWLGRPPLSPQKINATLTRKVHSSLGDDEYLRVTVGRVGERMIAAPLTRGAGVITSLVRADGIVLIPAGVQGFQTGESVHVRLYRSLTDIERTILVLGSHDLTIDLIAQYLSQRGSRLSSANLGSLGGLVALSRGEAHVAGSHLLDPESGEYNLPYIDKYLPGIPVVVIGYVTREQGLIVPPGNPKSLKDLSDLVKDGLTFVNRQKGAGTRILLDYHLEELGIDRDSIIGYGREEYTHLSVAAAVSSGAVDCGLGIRAAADALKLDFIPLYNERFDLVIPRAHYESPKLEPLVELLQEPGFQNAVNTIAGYDTAPMGEIIAEIG